MEQIYDNFYWEPRFGEASRLQPFSDRNLNNNSSTGLRYYSFQKLIYEIYLYSLKKPKTCSPGLEPWASLKTPDGLLWSSYITLSDYPQNQMDIDLHSILHGIDLSEVF